MHIRETPVNATQSLVQEEEEDFYPEEYEEDELELDEQIDPLLK